MSDQVVMTQTTASTGVASSSPPARTYDAWGVVSLIAGVVGTVVFVGTVLPIANTVRGWIRDRNGDERDLAADQRAATLEGLTSSRHFRPCSAGRDGSINAHPSSDALTRSFNTAAKRQP